MKRSGRIFALVSALSLLAAAVSCENKTEPVIEESVEEISEEPTEPENTFDISGQTITWLADYDLNPQENEPPAAALAMFRDFYGADVNFVYTSRTDKFRRLEEMINGGEEVDMFPYSEELMPSGIAKGLFEPLDPYFDIMGVDEGLWKDTEPVYNALEYGGAHYVMPYSFSNPLVVIYSRNTLKDEDIADPAELYKDGKWMLDTMREAMEKFVNNHEEGKTKYGVCGWFAEGVLRNADKSVVSLENGKLVNNITSPEIEAAELFLQDIAQKNLYNRHEIPVFPESGRTLFCVMGADMLGECNAANPDKDLMVVPFPKANGGSEQKMWCDLDAKMLVRNSAKGEVVAAYLKCERVAADDYHYQKIAREKAVSEENKARSFVTEEQYDALKKYMKECTPAVDCGFGMGERMNGDGDFTYETRGVMNNLWAVMSTPNHAPVESWDQLRDEMKNIIDDEIKSFN